jgi:hypothetical protein
MDSNNREAPQGTDRADEDLVEEAAEGLWLRLRDVILVNRKLERFVF